MILKILISERKKGWVMISFEFIRDNLGRWGKNLWELILTYLDPSSTSEEPAALVLDKTSVVSSREDSVRQHHSIMPRNSNNNSYYYCNNKQNNYNNNSNHYINYHNNNYYNNSNSMFNSASPQAEDLHLILESPELYEAVSLPHIKTEYLQRLQWVYKILDHRKEKQRIIFEDPNPVTGFILVPDPKWSGRFTSDLHCLAIVHQRGLKSLRDLRADHLPLLTNIREKAVSAVASQYGLQASQVRCYLHYQPSHYHLHVHITNLAHCPAHSADRIHLLDTVIFNIIINNNYYQAATIPFKVRPGDKLYKLYKDVGHFDPPRLHALPEPQEELEPEPIPEPQKEPESKPEPQMEPEPGPQPQPSKKRRKRLRKI